MAQRTLTFSVNDLVNSHAIEKEQRTELAEPEVPLGLCFTPRVDVMETEEESLLLAGLPGVRPEDVDVRFDNGELIVEPTTGPRPVPHAKQPRQMLENALAAEGQAIADHNERIRQAEAVGDIGLKVRLENQVADETRHKEEIERILSGWDELNLERARNGDRWQDDGGHG